MMVGLIGFQAIAFGTSAAMQMNMDGSGDTRLPGPKVSNDDWLKVLLCLRVLLPAMTAVHLYGHSSSCV